MNKLRVGVVGVGYLGQHHVRVYASMPGVRVVGIVDRDPARAKLIAERHHVPVAADVPALLSGVDAVSVAVPTSAHYPVVKACLDAGVHVLVEKPITDTLPAARELADLAGSRKLILQVGHIERFNPIVRQARPFIGRPAFIECHRLSPFGERGTDVDVVLDLMIHDLDMVLSFHPGAVEEIRAAGVPVLTPRVDIANARITFSSGCVANLTASRVSTSRLRRLRVFQRDGYLSLDYQTRQGVWCRRSALPDGQPVIETQPIRGSDEEPLKLELESFVRSVETGTAPVVGGDDGVAVLDLASRIQDAMERFLSRHVQEREG
jgi:predicted dehydrogenase